MLQRVSRPRPLTPRTTRSCPTQTPPPTLSSRWVQGRELDTKAISSCLMARKVLLVLIFLLDPLSNTGVAYHAGQILGCAEYCQGGPG
eukprot:scaffold170818_cov18-Tisochrysis_lutea.AAC.1